MKQKKILKRALSLILAVVLVAGTINVIGPNNLAVVEAAGENLITNGDFDSVSDWTYTGADDSTGNVPAQGQEKVMEPNVILTADCEDSSKDSSWVNYDANGTIRLTTDPTDSENRVASFTNTEAKGGLVYKPTNGFFEQGKTYTISFDYYGAAQINLYTLGLIRNQYDCYDDWLPGSDGKWTTYTFDITVTYEATSPAQRIYFNMATTTGGTFYIDNLTVTCGETEKTTEVATEVINLDFSSESNYSNYWVKEGNGTPTYSYDSGAIKLTATTSGSNFYFYQAKDVYGTGNTYKISYKYKSNVSFNGFTLGFHSNTSFIWYQRDIPMSTEWTEYSFTITTATSTDEMYSSPRIGFSPTGAGNVWIDDLVVEKVETVTETTYTQGIGTCIESGVPTEGDNVLYVEDYKSVSTPVEIKAGKRYEYSFQMKNGATGSDFDFDVQVGGAKVADVKSGELSASEDWETISGVFKAEADASTFGFLRSGAGEVYIDDVTLVELPSDHTPSLESGYIPEGAEVMIDDDFTSAPAGVLFVMGTNEKDYAYEDGMAVAHFNAYNTYFRIRDYEFTKGHTYVLSFYVWIQNANSFQLDMVQNSNSNVGPIGELSTSNAAHRNYLMHYNSSYEQYSLTIDGVEATDSMRNDTSGWKNVVLTWTAQATGTEWLYLRNFGTGSADVYIDDIVLYDNTKAAVQEKLLTNYYDLGSGTEGYLVTSSADETVTITDADGKTTTVENGNYTTINNAGEYTITRGGKTSDIVLYKRGDANEDYDGSITAKDLVATKKMQEGIVIASASSKAADVNADGVLNSKDDAFLRRVIVNDYDIINTTQGIASLGQGVMPIIGYDGPSNADDFKKFSALGMNYVVVNATDISGNDALAQEILEVAESNNVKVFLNNDKAVNPDEKSLVAETEDLASYNNVYDSYDSFAGYFVADGAYYKKQYTSDNGKYNANNGVAEYASVLGTIAKYVNVNSYFNLLPINSEALGYSFSGSEDSVNVTYDDYAAYALAASIAGSDFLSNSTTLSQGEETFYKNLAWMNAISQDETIAKPFYATVEVDENNTTNMYLEANAALAFGAKGIQYDAITEASSGVYSINKFIKAVDYILMDAKNKGVITTNNAIENSIDRGLIGNYGAVTSVTGNNALVGCFDYFGKDTYLVVNTGATANTFTLTFDEAVNGAVIAFAGTTSELSVANTYQVEVGVGESVLIVLDNASNMQSVSGEDNEDTSIATNMQDTIVKANAIANAVQGYYTDGNKTSYVVKNQNMKLTHGLRRSTTVLTTIENAEGKPYIEYNGNAFDAVIQLTGADKAHYSNESTTDIWANTTQMGYYYYETRLQQMNFGSSIANMYLEKTYHTYADKMYQEFRVIATNDVTESQVKQLGFRAYVPKSTLGDGGMVCSKDGSTVYTDVSSGNNTNLQYVGFDIKDAGVIGFIVAGQTGVNLQVTEDPYGYYVSQYVTSPTAFKDFTAEETANWRSNHMTVPTGYITFGNRVYTDATHSFEGLKQANYEEQNPLTADNITVDESVSGAQFVGYDYLTGAYEFNISGSGYTGAFNEKDNANYFEHIQIRDVPDNRTIYLDVHAVSGGGTEGAALVDSNGEQIPVPMQVSKNFANENVTEIYNNDTVYGETYMPLCVEAGEEYDFTVINAYWNWGNKFPIKQLSSIEYYTSYYHMSTGTVETTCIAPYYAANGNDGFFEGISYFLPDFRGMSNDAMTGDEVQNNSVGVVYGPNNGSSLGTYTSSAIHSTGLTYSDLDYSYISDDGKYKYTMRHVEMPQEDESRTYYTIEFEILEDTTLTQKDFEIVGFDGKNGVFYKAAYLNANGVHTEMEICDNKWSWSEWADVPTYKNKGYYPLHEDGSYFTFYDMELISNDYSQTGNFGLVVKDSDVKLAFANQTHKPNYWHKQEINYGYLTLAADTAFKAGDKFAVDLILLPYGTTENQGNCDSVVEVYNDSAANPIKVTATAGTVVEDAWVPTVKATNNTAEFALTGGVNTNTSNDTVNYAVKVTGFDSLMMPLIQQKVDGEWITYDYATALGYDGYSVSYEDDGTYSYSFVFAQTAAGNTFRVMPSKNVKANYYVDGVVAKTIQTKTGEIVAKPDAKTLGIFGRQIEGYYTDPAFVKEFNFSEALSDDVNIYVKLSDSIYIDADMMSMMSQANVTDSEISEDNTYGKTYKISRGTGAINLILYKTGMNLEVGINQTLQITMKTSKINQLQVKVLGTYVDANGTEHTTIEPTSVEDTLHWNQTRYVQAISTSNDGNWMTYTFDLSNPNDATGLNEPITYKTITGLLLFTNPSSDGTNYGQTAEIASIEQKVDSEHVVSYVLADGTALTTQNVAHDKQIGDIPTADIETSSAMLGYKVGGYYMDAACTVPYDFGNWIAKDTTVYVTKSENFYLDANVLKTFTASGNSNTAITVAEDGSLSLSGNNGAYMFNKALKLDMTASEQKLNMNMKHNGNVTRVDVWIFGTYELNGEESTVTDEKVRYFVYPGTDYAEKEVNLAAPYVGPTGDFTGIVWKEITGFRIDIMTNSSAGELNIQSIESK